MEFILAHEPWIRVGASVLLFASLAAGEALAPRRARAFSRRDRWPANLLLTLLNTALLRLILPAAAVATALFAKAEGIGILHLVELPLWVEVGLAFAVLDATVYAQHLAFHRMPLLWRLHLIHHADPDVDVTTGLRFHPIEIILSQLIKMAAVLALGAPALAVILFEVVLNATSQFNHANLKLPRPVDGWLRLLIVTPDMHRTHHSQFRDERDTNYGFNLSLWDRVFGTYRAAPRGGQEGMKLGLIDYPGSLATGLWWMMAAPFAARSPRRAEGA